MNEKEPEIVLEHGNQRSRYKGFMQADTENLPIMCGESRDGTYYETDLREVTKVCLDIDGELVSIWEGESLMQEDLETLL